MAVLSRNFRLRCEAISSDWRERLGLRVIDPLPANVLAKNLGATLRRPEEIDIKQEAIDYLCQANDWFGMILCLFPPLILYNPNQPAARYESTIMHELAHIILEHPSGKLYLVPDGTFNRSFNSKIEAEAAYLGSCLQISRRGILWAIQSEMNNEDIADYFGASLEMVRWRLNAVNLN